jgi:hypothetical protein
MKRPLLLLIALVMTLSSAAFATNSFRTMNYQGRLTDLSGNPVADGNYVITFRLYDDPSALIGAAKWTETLTNIEAKNGYFNAVLGSVNPMLSKTIDFNTQYWLGVQVGADNEMTPRQALSGVPFTLNYDVPIGSIMAYCPSMPNTPPMSAQWVECNGQTLNDTESPYNGIVIPNLNGDPGGANSPGFATKESLFLRGGMTSGSGETDQLQGHFHARGWSVATGGTFYGPTITINNYQNLNLGMGGDQFTNLGIGKPISDGINGAVNFGSETRPKSMSVIWIMKIK